MGWKGSGVTWKDEQRERAVVRLPNEAVEILHETLIRKRRRGVT